MAAKHKQEQPEWVTGNAVDRSGLAQYTHLIRSPDDPERSPREARKGKETAWLRLTAKATRGAWKTSIAALLADGVPRTFNRIAVELSDMTADVVFGKAPDQALWELVHEGAIEHTTKAPILFRQRVVEVAP